MPPAPSLGIEQPSPDASTPRFHLDYGEHRFRFLRPFLARVTSPSHFRRRSHAIYSHRLPLISTPPVLTSVRDRSSGTRASSLPIFKTTKESQQRIDFRSCQNARYLSVPAELSQADEIADSPCFSTPPVAIGVSGDVTEPIRHPREHTVHSWTAPNEEMPRPQEAEPPINGGSWKWGSCASRTTNQPSAESKVDGSSPWFQASSSWLRAQAASRACPDNTSHASIMSARVWKS
jgi:hypothetical protein